MPRIAVAVLSSQFTGTMKVTLPVFSRVQDIGDSMHGKGLSCNFVRGVHATGVGHRTVAMVPLAWSAL